MFNEEMATCPHCGGAAYLHQNRSYRSGEYFVFVKCDVCGAQGKSYHSGTEPAAAEWDNQPCHDAVAAWNLRTPTQHQEGNKND